jgi:hypothetical protein
MRKPTVITKCVANAYTGDNERIVEFCDREASEPTGGLIAFRRLPDGKLLVSVYNVDPTVEVRAPVSEMAKGEEALDHHTLRRVGLRLENRFRTLQRDGNTAIRTLDSVRDMWLQFVQWGGGFSGDHRDVRRELIDT